MVESITTTVRAPSIPVINIHLLESTLITELKSHFFCFLQVQWLIDNYETAEGVSLVTTFHPVRPII
jgi:hypothetical protein